MEQTHSEPLGQTKYHRGEVVCQGNRQWVPQPKGACPVTPYPCSYTVACCP